MGGFEKYEEGNESVKRRHSIYPAILMAARASSYLGDLYKN